MKVLLCSASSLPEGMAADQTRPIAVAQRRLPGLRPYLHAGPNIDGMDDAAYQADRCHLSQAGLERVASAWAALLVQVDGGNGDR